MAMNSVVEVLLLFLAVKHIHKGHVEPLLCIITSKKMINISQRTDYLGTDVMHAGGNVLGRSIASEHVTLQYIGQLVPSHVCKVPVMRKKRQCSCTYTHSSVEDERIKMAM